MTDQAPQRVSSKDARANEIIANLRKALKGAATEIAALGDDAVHWHEELESAQVHESSVAAEAEEATGLLAEWRIALEDYRRGILDKEEMFLRTVGYG